MTDGNKNEQESLSTEESKQLFRDYIHHEMQAAEKMTELANKYDKPEINDTAEEVFNDLHPKIESHKRKGNLYAIMLQVGQAINSQSMVNEIQRLIEEHTDK